MQTTPADRPGGRDLVLERVLDAPRTAVWRCWTEPELMVRWFTPEPWSTVSAELDLVPGGAMRTVMRSPEGAEHDNLGVLLEVDPGRKLVFTDAFLPGWVPTEKPFFVAVVTLADAEGGRTAYRAEARHWRDEDRAAHEAMGFHDGWGKAADQLEALARTL